MKSTERVEEVSRGSIVGNAYAKSKKNGFGLDFESTGSSSVGSAPEVPESISLGIRS